MYSPDEKMPEEGKEVWLMTKPPTVTSRAYFDGKYFRLTQHWFKYEVLPADVQGWKYAGE